MSGLQPSSASFAAISEADGLGWDNNVAPLALGVGIPRPLSRSRRKTMTPKGVWSRVGSGYNRPEGVAVDSSGNVLVTDRGSNQAVEVTPAGVRTFLWDRAQQSHRHRRLRGQERR